MGCSSQEEARSQVQKSGDAKQSCLCRASKDCLQQGRKQEKKIARKIVVLDIFLRFFRGGFMCEGNQQQVVDCLEIMRSRSPQLMIWYLAWGGVFDRYIRRFGFHFQLMLSEWLLEKPDEFESDRVMVPCPVGKRNLVIAAGVRNI